PGALTNALWLVASRGFVYLSGVTAAGRELWRTDGTTTVTVDLQPGATNSNPTYLGMLHSQFIYFAIDDPITGEALKVYRVNPPAISGSPIALIHLGDVSTSIIDDTRSLIGVDQFYFSAYDQLIGFGNPAPDFDAVYGRLHIVGPQIGHNWS